MSWEVGGDGERETDLQTVIRGRLFVFSASCFRELLLRPRRISMYKSLLTFTIFAHLGGLAMGMQHFQDGEVCFHEGSIL